MSYKVGDKVTPYKIKGTSSSDYPYAFPSNMVTCKETIIERVVDRSSDNYRYCNLKAYPFHDGFGYYLKGMGSYIYSSSMFKETYEI